jgi:hypothetical protein
MDRNGRGGAIFSYTGDLHLINSTLTDNMAKGGHGMGGALFSTGRVFLVNSTFSGNRAMGNQGGKGIVGSRNGQNGNGWRPLRYRGFRILPLANCEAPHFISIISFNGTFRFYFPLYLI